jgi:adenosine deaminase
MPVLTVLEGFAEGERDFGIRCRLVLDCVHGFPLELAQSTLAAALRHRDDGVIALGLGGDERKPIDELVPVFRAAVDGALHSVPHAGETTGPATIRAALDLLNAERLGHGIRVLDDDELVAEVRERGIPLEVCPTSNVATGVVPTVQDHPFPRLRDAGLTVTLNSDDPGMFASPLCGEYELARTVFDLNDDALAGVAKAGMRASFLDDADKAALEADIDAWTENHAQ